MRTLRWTILMGLFTLCMTMPLAWAQQQSPVQDQTVNKPVQPIQAIHSPLASVAGNGDDTDQNEPQPLTPDTRPVTGVQDLSLGTPAGTQTYWQPRVSLTSTFDSNPPFSTTNQGGWTNWTSFFGGIDLHRNSENSDLTASYWGGGSISSAGGVGNTTFQQMGLAEQLLLGRSTVSFFDELLYLPGSSFGYLGPGGIPIPGGGVLGFQNGFVPGQSIQTFLGQRIANSFVTQVNTSLTPRSSLTFVGGYNLLHYFDADLLNSNGYIFQAGYNYQLTREDTLSVFYRFNALRYSNFSQSINNNSFQVAYARRVTGRLAFRVGAGPSFSSFQVPISGSSTLTGGGTAAGPTSQTFLGVNMGLTYQAGRTGLGLTYSRGISGGSGVLAGAVSDFLTGTATRQLSRTWSSNFHFGYARNTGLSIATLVPTSQTYNYTFAGVNLNYLWGRDMTMSLGYQLQYQNSSAPACVGPTCGTGCTGTICTTSYVRHAVILGFSWQTQPIPF